MVLHAVFVSFMALFIIALKGPLEIAFLNYIGLSLIENFSSTAKSPGFEFSLKGGALILILIAQPIYFSLLFLKSIDKVFRMFIIEATKEYGSLDISPTKTKPKTKADVKSYIGHGQQEEPPIVGGFQQTAAAAFDTRIDFKKPILRDVIVDIIWFRGSSRHFLVIIVSFFLHIIAFADTDFKIIILTTFTLCASIALPSTLLYNIFISEYVRLTQVNRGSIIASKSRFYSQAYQLFRRSRLPYMPALRRIVYVVQSLAFFVMSQINGYWLYNRNDTIYQEVKAEEELQKDLSYRIGVRAFSRTLVQTGQIRDGRYEFMANWYGEYLIGKSRLIRVLTRFAPIF